MTLQVSIILALSSLLNPLNLFSTESVTVKCCQTGKTYTVKVTKLSKENMEPLTEEDLSHGSSLLMDYKGKSYEVQVVEGNEICYYS